MPKIEPRQIQKELEAGELWPVYWIYGSERMKARELLKRIRRAAIFPDLQSGPESDELPAMGSHLGEEVLDGTEVSAEAVLDSARSIAMGGGLRFVIVRNAHALKDPESLEELFGPKAARDSLYGVCVFLSKDLDQRKKFSKKLLKSAAVVPCEEIADADRDAWIQYLAKRRGLNLDEAGITRLHSLDPWSLDIIDSELAKFEIALDAFKETSSDPVKDASAVLQGQLGTDGGAEIFLDAFFARDLARTLRAIETFADRPDEAMPLLGLFAWNVRQLAAIAADRKKGTRSVKLNPYVARKLEAWTRSWKLEDIIALQRQLSEVDFGLKQTRRLPLGLWTDLATRFCRAPRSS